VFLRAAIFCLLLVGCDSDAPAVLDLAAAAMNDLAVNADLTARPDDLSAAPPDLSLVQPSMAPDASVPVLAPPGDTAQTMSVDGITCDGSEQLLFHIHSHLQMYVSGQEELVAAGVGIGTPLQEIGGIVYGGSCFSWLHTHDESGIIHIESPVSRQFTLGDFFDIWGQPLSATQVGPAQGSVTAFVDGALWTADPRTILLANHTAIQLDVGDPLIAPQPFTWPPGY
jgi:hypothetical protein